MMGERRVDQGALFYEFSLERHVPEDHLLRAVDIDGVRAHLASFYSLIGRPSIDPELMIRMLLPQRVLAGLRASPNWLLVGQSNRVDPLPGHVVLAHYLFR